MIDYLREERMLRAIVMCLVSCTALFSYASVGDEAPDFHMTDINGQEVSLNQFKGKIVVLEWANPKSPYVRKQYSRDTNEGVGNIQTMQKRYTQPSVGVVWITIDSSSKESGDRLSPDEWKAQLQQWGAHPTALIIDDLGELAKLYGAERTPEVFVIGRDGKLLYRGAVDSLRGTDPGEIDRYNNLPWLKNAIENAIQDKRVVPPETIPYGTSIRFY